MHDPKRIFLKISFDGFYPKLSRTFKHNTVMIQVTENGSGLTLGWSGTPQYKDSVEGADTVLRGSVRAPEEFSKGKPEAAKPRGRSPRGFAVEGLPKAQCRHPRHSPVGTVNPLCPKDFQQLLRLPKS